MREKQRGFSFRGFVALADLLFAVSAGLLLLNPVQFDDLPAPEEIAKADPATIAARVEEAERLLPVIEKQLEQIRAMSREVLKSEQP